MNTFFEKLSQDGEPSYTTQRLWAVEQTMPSSVIIYGGSDELQWSGSGFLINEEGYVLTCAHVANPHNKAPLPKDLNLRGSLDGIAFYPMHALLLNYDLDVAVLQFVEVSEVTRSVIPDLGHATALHVGTPIIAIGAPEGIDHIATSGIVASSPRAVPGVAAEIFFIDVTILPGSSGGMIITHEAEVVGIARGSIGAEEGAGPGLNYCIAIDSVKDWLNAKGVVFYEAGE